MNFSSGHLIIRPKRQEPPERTPLKSKPTRLQAPPEMRRRMDELKKRVIEKNPDLAHPPGAPERAPLKLKVQPKPPERSPLNIKVKPKSYFEWVRAA